MLGILRLSLALVVIVTLAACGTFGAAPTTAQSFAVTAKEFGFAPAQLTVKAP
jgi:hypothetical protein